MTNTLIYLPNFYLIILKYFTHIYFDICMCGVVVIVVALFECFYFKGLVTSTHLVETFGNCIHFFLLSLPFSVITCREIYMI